MDQCFAISAWFRGKNPFFHPSSSRSSTLNGCVMSLKLSELQLPCLQSRGLKIPEP